MIEMTPKQAMKVIKDAKKLGVTKMKLGTLEFELTGQEHEPRAPRPALKASKKAAEQIDVQQQFDKAREDLATLHVEDPAAFEQAIVENELEDADDGENEETQSL